MTKTKKNNDITLELIEACIADGELSQAANLLQELTGHSMEEVLPLIDALARETNNLEDVKLFKKWGWTIRASLCYQQLFGDQMNLVKQIIDTMGEPADDAKIEGLIAGGNQIEASDLIRLHTGLGPEEANAEVRKLLQCELTKVIEMANHSSRLTAIRKYQRLHGCSLHDAKQGVDELLTAATSE